MSEALHRRPDGSSARITPTETPPMPQVTVEGIGSFEVPQGKRLVNALIDECGQDQLHACGGVAKCTTCRVEVVG